MKSLKLVAGIVAAATAAISLTSAVGAYDFGNKNLGKNWSINAEIPAEEFASLTENSYVTITFDVDQTETEYWCIKPCDKAESWVFIDPDGVGGPELSEGKDSYPIQQDDTSITFKVPSQFVESVKANGMAIMGHSITLKEMTISDKAPETEAAPETSAPAESGTGAAGDVNKPSDDKNNANTGIEGVAVVAAIAVLSASAIVISRKRK